MPFEQRLARIGAQPAYQVAARNVEQLRAHLDFGGNGLVKGQTAPIDPRVRSHSPSIDDGLQDLISTHGAPGPGRTGAQDGRLGLPAASSRGHRPGRAQGRDRERYQVVYGARLKVKDGQAVDTGMILVEWDPYTFSILTEEPGQIRFKDIIDGVTVQEDLDEVTGLSRLIVVDSPDEKKQPTVEIKSANGTTVRRYIMPVSAHLMVQDGEMVNAGDVLAKIPRETTKTKDITGGLPPHGAKSAPRGPRSAARRRVVRGPQAEGSGRDQRDRRFGEVRRRGQRPAQDHDRGRRPERRAAWRGPRRADFARWGGVLHVLGEKELQKYLVNEIQEIYLRGLKENVTMGRLIPAGTGFWWYRHVQIPADEPPPPPPVQQPSDDELELDREMEYLVEPDEVDARGTTEV